ALECLREARWIEIARAGLQVSLETLDRASHLVAIRAKDVIPDLERARRDARHVAKPARRQALGRLAGGSERLEIVHERDGDDLREMADRRGDAIVLGGRK